MKTEPRLLLVEDDERIAAAIRIILSDAGFASLEVVCTAARAECHVISARPDLVLVDLGLPDRDGIELIRRLRAVGVLQPILVVTSATAADRVLAALQAGADGYLYKEDMNARLAGALRELVQGGTPLSRGASRAVLAELRRCTAGPRNDVVLPDLTGRERRVLDLLSTGASYADIGRELDIGVNTVRTHIRGLYDKLGVQNGPEAVSLGWSLGLLRPGA
jgi:DNA-binding NarL/FixJ family response regulator